jgi:eukaryotic-like serine/threonine-protein kinase
VRLHLQLDAACQAADALAHLHRLDAVHRDIKPANLLRSRAGTLKLADFGTAKMRQATAITRTAGEACGTYHYMAPGSFLARISAFFQARLRLC